MEVYLIELDSYKIFSHHIEIIKLYFPSIKIYKNHFIVATPCIELDDLHGIHFESIDRDDCPCEELLNFVNGDENDIFALRHLIKSHGWYKIIGDMPHVL